MWFVIHEEYDEVEECGLMNTGPFDVCVSLFGARICTSAWAALYLCALSFSVGEIFPQVHHSPGVCAPRTAAFLGK